MRELVSHLVDRCLFYKGGIYIEAGANNGMRQSSTMFLEKHLGWKGILIEPNVKKMEICKANRSKENLFYTCALAPNESVKTITGNFDEDDPGESLGASCVDIANLDYYDDSYKQAIQQKIKDKKQIEVPAKTLNSILSENQLYKIDFLSLDLEGYELEILKSMNFDMFDVSYIMVETANIEKYENLVNEFMKNNNYTHYKKISNNDHLYKKNKRKST